MPSHTGTRRIHKTNPCSDRRREYGNRSSYSQLKNEMKDNERPYLILFGTGYGLLPKILEESDIILEPIRGM